MLRKTLVTLTTAAFLAATLTAVPTTASAGPMVKATKMHVIGTSQWKKIKPAKPWKHHHHHNGFGPVAAGAIFGLAAGAIIAGAASGGGGNSCTRVIEDGRAVFYCD